MLLLKFSNKQKKNNADEIIRLQLPANTTMTRRKRTMFKQKKKKEDIVEVGGALDDGQENSNS